MTHLKNCNPGDSRPKRKEDGRGRGGWIWVVLALAVLTTLSMAAGAGSNTTTMEKGRTEPAVNVTEVKLTIGPTASIIEKDKPNVTSKSEIGVLATDWITIKYEGFEGVFPGSWTLYGDPTWCDTNYRSSVGSWSGWNACGGSNGVQAGAHYPPNMNAWMVYGPFDLSDAQDAEVTFQHWTKTEANYDFFSYAVSIDGANFYATSLSGDWTGGSNPWKPVTFDCAGVKG